MNNIKLSDYAEFVDSVTSEESKSNDVLINKICGLENDYGDYVNFSRLLTSAIGLSSETGEFSEIVKKIFFQGKECNEDTQWHMKRELGDILWYWVQGCMALDIDPHEVMMMNIDKLKSRYPGGKFDVWFSENRKKGDL